MRGWFKRSYKRCVSSLERYLPSPLVRAAFYLPRNCWRCLDFAVWTGSLNAGKPNSSPIVVFAHEHGNSNLNYYFAEWVRVNFPEAHQQICYRRVTDKPEALAGCRAATFWLQDPVQGWSERVYRQCLKIEAHCDSEGIQLINRPSRYRNVDRYEASLRLARAGFRTPAVERIPSWQDFLAQAGGLQFPFILRERVGQTGTLYKIDSPDALRNPELLRLQEPVKVEWIDVSGTDKRFFRKYRTFVLGDYVIPHHLHITDYWVTRGEFRNIEEWSRNEELAFIEAEPECADTFRQASRELGLEYLAFDFGRLENGEMVVWEANPFPFVWFSHPNGGTLYRSHAIHRTFAATLALFLQSAGLKLPARIENLTSMNRQRYDRAAQGLIPIY